MDEKQISAREDFTRRAANARQALVVANAHHNRYLSSYENKALWAIVRKLDELADIVTEYTLKYQADRLLEAGRNADE